MEIVGTLLRMKALKFAVDDSTLIYVCFLTNGGNIGQECHPCDPLGEVLNHRLKLQTSTGTTSPTRCLSLPESKQLDITIGGEKPTPILEENQGRTPTKLAV